MSIPGPDDAWWVGLIDDAAMFPPGSAPAPQAVTEHREHRRAWYAPMIGPLVVADTALAAVDREIADESGPDAGPVAVSVINTGGAGGLTALAGRTFGSLRITGVESAVRDLDDPAGAARRLVAAARELDDAITVWVEFPRVRGWLDAVEVVEAAGLAGKIRTGGLEPDDHPTAEALAEQLSCLVEADLPFKATAGLHHALPRTERSETGASLPRHGFLTLMLAVAALVDDAPTDEVVAVLRERDPERVAERVRHAQPGTGERIRRRFRSFGCCGVTDPVDDLVGLGLLSGS